MSSTAETTSPSPPASFPFPEMLPVGSVLDGAYEITGHLGRGGFADVYSAVKRDIGMDVALKVLRTIGDAETQREVEHRFLQDAQAAARIRHPNVVTILSLHERMVLHMPSGNIGAFDRFYFAMELLDGRALDEVIEFDGRMDPARALRLLTRTLEGLAEGHRKKIVHKDLKPDNLFLAYPDKMAESLKILDFGVAMIGYDDGQRLTRPGTAICTPEYTAPEYFEQGIVSPAVDVYQMGLILIEMLQGEPLVKGRPFECIREHTQGIELPEELMRGALGPVLRCATALDHTARYPDAEAFCAALREIDPDEVWPSDPIEITDDDIEPEPAAPAPIAAPSGWKAVPPLVLWIALAGALSLAGVMGALALYAFSQDPEAPGVDNAVAAGAIASPCGAPKDCFEAGSVASQDGELLAAVDHYIEACERGHGRACVNLGWMQTEGRGTDPDDKKALVSFRRGCASGEGEGCTALGVMYDEGRAVRKSIFVALEFYQAGCEADDGWGCHLLGEFYEGKGLLKKSFEFYTEACDKDDAAGCTNLGRMYEANRGFVKRDINKAIELHDRSCKDGETEGCTNLGRLYQEGIGVPRDLSRAVELYDKACNEQDYEACAALGNLAENGEGMVEDTARALALYDRACKHEVSKGCRFHKRLQKKLDSEEE